MSDQIRLTNSSGTRVNIITRGAAITSLQVADRAGNFDDVVLGFDDPDQYLDNPNYFGIVAGRFANRIAKGQCSVNGETLRLAQNNGDNHLHGGPGGFHLQEWSVAAASDSGDSVILQYTSVDGEEGFPGNLDVSVTYRLTDANELVIEYQATTDRPTILNLTQHTYFNLAGHASRTVLDHELSVLADHYTPVDPSQIPTGDITAVAGSAFDLRNPTRVAEVLARTDQQLVYGSGLDHNYVLKSAFDSEMQHVATVRDPGSGRTMEVLTDQPGMQVYTGNFIGEGCEGKNSAVYGPYQGLCLETQHFPDSPNHSHFPSTQLDPGKVFTSRTVYAFGTD